MKGMIRFLRISRFWGGQGGGGRAGRGRAAGGGRRAGGWREGGGRASGRTGRGASEHGRATRRAGGRVGRVAGGWTDELTGERVHPKPRNPEEVLVRGVFRFLRISRFVWQI